MPQMGFHDWYMTFILMVFLDGLMLMFTYWFLFFCNMC